MASGEGVDQDNSRRGPRGRARARLFAAASDEFHDIVDELKVASRALQEAIQENVPGGIFRDLLEKWIDTRTELNEARNAWSELMTTDEYDQHRDAFADIFASFETVRTQAMQYIEELTTEQPGFEDPEEQVRRLEREVARLRAEIEQRNVHTGPQASSSRTDNVNNNAVVRTPAVSRIDPTPPDDQGGGEEMTDRELLRGVMKAMSGAANSNFLPRAEPAVFTGKILDFPAWWNSFETLVEQETDNYSRRVFLLEQYTDKAAKDSIRAFLKKRDKKLGYELAKSTLHARFGDRLKLSDAYLSEIHNWPAIRRDDAHALQRYADFLWQCDSVREDFGYLDVLDSAEENKRMASKLPRHLMDRWNRKVSRLVRQVDEDDESGDLSACITVNYGEYPKFRAFCLFVSEEARVADGPCAAKPEKREESHGRSLRRAGNYSTQADNQPRKLKCVHCDQEHHVRTCESFSKLPYEQKKEVAVREKLCYGCLGRGHCWRTCRRNDPKLMGRPPRTSANNMATKAQVLHTNKEGESVYSSMIVMAYASHVDNPTVRKLIYVVLDSQSDSCFLDADLLRDLNVKGDPCELELTTMHDTTVEASEEVSGLMLQGVYESTVLGLPRSFVRKKIPVNRASIPRPEMTEGWSHLKSVGDMIPEYDPDIPVAMLIGYNCPSALLPDKTKKGRRNDPFACHTELGWSLIGPIVHRDGKKVHRSLQAMITASRNVTSEQICRAFDYDFVQPGDSSFEKRSKEDAKFMKIMEEGLEFTEEGRVQLPLPLRERKKALPDSRGKALKRAFGTKKKFEKSEDYKDQYVRFIMKMLDAYHAERAEPLKEGEEALYLPHQGVTHPQKKDLRVVWDGSSETEGVSLNSLLMSGPDMSNKLIGVLIRFRLRKKAYLCDVEKMFLQVLVPAIQRNLMRFFFYPNGDTTQPLKEYRLTVHLFGATSSPACAMYAFRAVADKYADQFSPEVVEFIKRNFYVDDGLGSEDDEETVLKMIRESHELCKKGCFNLRKYASNSREVMEQVPEELRAPVVNEWLSQPADQVEKEPKHLTLGMFWWLMADALGYASELPQNKMTRRGMLSSLGSIYDPLGLISPALLEGRLILQDLCRAKFSWDAPIPEPMIERWCEWVTSMSSLPELRIPRCFMKTVTPEGLIAILRLFSDASKRGYGACAYLVLQDPRGNEDRSLVAAKSRVGPVKAVTVPRLELQAAVIAIKMSDQLQEEIPMKLAAVEYYTDSTPVLGYIYNDTARHSIFVDNRAQLIRDKSDKTQWSHVDTELNPADITSRGMPLDELMKNQLWLHGPDSDYLEKKRGEKRFPLQEDDPELKRCASVHAVSVKPRWVLSQFERYSSWRKMVRVTAWCRRFLGRFVDKCRKRAPRHLAPTLQVEELNDAEDAFVRLVQRESFPAAVQALRRMDENLEPEAESRSAARRRKREARKESNIYQLDPYLDEDENLRVGGRVQAADMPREFLHPRVLPGKHFATAALIRMVHREMRHSGRNATLHMLRARGWWVTQGRAAVDREKRKCVFCKRVSGPLESQKMGNLPEERTQPTPPFTHCGADLMGPFNIREKRSTLKRWVCLFTCMSSRAVHLEVCKSLSTSSFLLAFRRFTDRRGPVRTLKTDCGPNFKGAPGELSKALKEMDLEKVTVDLAERGCDLVVQSFNTPHAPHKGGVWERLVAVVKRAMEPVLAQHGEHLDDETFSTVVTEAEAIVNSRPITPVDMSDPDCLQALSPAMLLTSKTTSPKPLPGVFVPEDRYSRRTWRRAQYVADQYWLRWRKEYLPLLQQRHKWTSVRPNLRVNDIVLMKEENLPRMQWPLGRIVEVTESRDDQLVREVKVRTAKGQYVRAPPSIVLLYRPDVEENSQSESLNCIEGI